MPIKLIDYLNNEPYIFGNVEGKRVFSELQNHISAHPENKVFSISLEGVSATDASFPRESVISLAKMYKGELGFFLCDFSSKDLLDNWSYAAAAKELPIIVKNKDGYEVIGPNLTDSSKELLKFIMDKGSVTTALVAKKFDISIQNASAKLKKLLQLGLILGHKETAETGGLEFVFIAIK